MPLTDMPVSDRCGFEVYDMEFTGFVGRVRQIYEQSGLSDGEDDNEGWWD